MKEEVADECNYTQEAACMSTFRSPERLSGESSVGVGREHQSGAGNGICRQH
jgi:hypothetical protein